MKVWSDTLSTDDIRHATAGTGAWVAELSRIDNPRTRAHGWNIYLEGSSPYRSQATGGKAATWDQWGLWMARVFELDSDARIGPYDGRQSFIEQTTEQMEHQRRYIEEYGGKPDAGKTAPWLDPVKLRLEYLRGEIRAERISYGEIAELQGLAEQIDPSDVELLEWAGVPEGERV